MPKSNSRQLLREILAEMIRISQLTSCRQYEDFYRDEKDYASLAGSLKIISERVRHVPTIIRVKYALIPWNELSELEEKITGTDPVNRPKLLWKIATETLPRIRPVLENLEKEMEV
ncbi:DUF86 domain-containing protein [Methanoregula sp.]|jgi:uncharacterized protein with HEPN domain|uniref:HepT-like ribonuclease domain-containing protein n=1 Tax=Methanoregula sp. TaxID=2052170 RepID=UPI003C148B61